MYDYKNRKFKWQYHEFSFKKDYNYSIGFTSACPDTFKKDTHECTYKVMSKNVQMQIGSWDLIFSVEVVYPLTCQTLAREKYPHVKL